MFDVQLEYIYKNQIKSLRDNFGVKLDNVNFCTYTWLVNHELDMLDMFEYLILDEFHRAGAVKWGIKVQELMKKNPDAKVLGLTATNIRYLDNQRDMADEIFQNAIASYMDLSEAIAIGIFIVFLLECLDNKIKTPEDIEACIGIPVLGTVHYYETGDNKKSKKNKRK